MRNLAGGGVSPAHFGQAPPPTGAAARPFGSSGAAARPCGPSGALHVGGGGGFALHEAFRGRVVGVSDPRVVQFPRLVAVSTQLEVVWCPKCRPPQ